MKNKNFLIGFEWIRCWSIHLLFLCTGFSFSQTTASSQVTQITVEAPQLNTHKNIWIYLPVGYNSSFNANYPVLYLQDGQNLFDQSTSYAGEWNIDETLDSLQLDLIVVGIEHGNEKRIDELTPFKHLEYGGGEAYSYLEFLVKTLKPEIDAIYRTKSGPEHSYIGGSSLGGLFATYGILKHPEVFGKALVFSPSYWFSPEIFEFADNVEPERIKDLKLYIRAGERESETMIPLIHKMKNQLIKTGVNSSQIDCSAIEDGEHSEKFWASLFPPAAQWLLGN